MRRAVNSSGRLRCFLPSLPPVPIARLLLLFFHLLLELNHFFHFNRSIPRYRLLNGMVWNTYSVSPRVRRGRRNCDHARVHARGANRALKIRWVPWTVAAAVAVAVVVVVAAAAAAAAVEGELQFRAASRMRLPPPLHWAEITDVELLQLVEAEAGLAIPSEPLQRMSAAFPDDLVPAAAAEGVRRLQQRRPQRAEVAEREVAAA